MASGCVRALGLFGSAGRDVRQAPHHQRAVLVFPGQLVPGGQGAPRHRRGRLDPGRLVDASEPGLNLGTRVPGPRPVVAIVEPLIDHHADVRGDTDLLRGGHRALQRTTDHHGW